MLEKSILHEYEVQIIKLVLRVTNYENTPMQYTAIFHGCKKDNFQTKSFYYFHIFALNIYCGYMLEPPQ